MLMTISPAKTLDFENARAIDKISYPAFSDEADYLVKKLQKFTPRKIKSLMDISNALADLNYERFQTWTYPFNIEEAREALFVFNGDVYQGLSADTLSQDSINYLQKSLTILSGLYGALKPLDSILPYRLEMGSSLKVTPAKSNLYKYWGLKITDYLNEQLEKDGSGILINLASNEYFKSVNKKKLNAQIIVPEFKDWKNGEYKMLSFFAKKARGMMVRFIAENNITEIEHIKSFDKEGYYFNNSLSTEEKWVFTRDQ